MVDDCCLTFVLTSLLTYLASLLTSFITTSLNPHFLNSSRPDLLPYLLTYLLSYLLIDWLELLWFYCCPLSLFNTCISLLLTHIHCVLVSFFIVRFAVEATSGRVQRRPLPLASRPLHDLPLHKETHSITHDASQRMVGITVPAIYT